MRAGKVIVHGTHYYMLFRYICRVERKQFIGPSLNAPRHRDIPTDFLSHSAKDPTGFFARMKEQHPELSKYTNRDLAKCIELYNRSLTDEVVSNGWQGLRLPEDLGFVIVGAGTYNEQLLQHSKTVGRIALNTSQKGSGYLIYSGNLRHGVEKLAIRENIQVGYLWKLRKIVF